MVKFLKHFLVIFLFGVTLTAITYANQLGDQGFNDLDVESNFPYIDEMILSSSRYTQKDETDPAKISDYVNNYQVRYTEEELALMGFEEVLSNDKYILYFETRSFSILLYDVEGDFYWSSRAEGILNPSEANLTTRNKMNSGILIDFVRVNRPDILQNESLLSITSTTYQQNNEDLPEKIRPYVFNNLGSTESQMVSVTKTVVDNTLKTQVKFKSIKQAGLTILIPVNIEFEVNITLTDDGINVQIPAESINEGSENFRLMSISVFPYFGSARQNKVPGYFVLPDQIGALVRLNSQYNAQIPEMPFYSHDYAYNATARGTTLSVPIFGVVHQVGEHAFYGEVVDGAENTSLQLQLWNQSTQYHRINPKFLVRKLYQTVIDRAGNGAPAIISRIAQSNYEINYRLLNDEDASYVGIAKNYRDVLLEQDVLSARERTVNSQIPLLTSYILSDQEPSFIGTSKVTMTTLNQVKSMYEYFKENGLLNQTVNLQGWSNDGNLLKTPYRMSLVQSESDFSTLSKGIKDDQNLIFIENNYVMGTNESARVSYNNDLALGMNQIRLTFRSIGLNDRSVEYRYILPEKSLEFAQQDLQTLSQMGVSGMLINSLGNDLTSYLKNNVPYDRNETMQYYQNLAGLYDKLALNHPNQYLWNDLDVYMEMDISNDQYNYYTDLVPLVPMILKGSISYFSDYLNFNVFGKQQLLQMIDFGINPSYIFTHESTYKMRYTESAIYFTTKFDDFKSDVLTNYEYMNHALKHVVGTKFQDRQVLQTGVVKVTYENGVTIYINYTSQTVNVDGQVLAPTDYKVVI